jgi:hypothetical protein
LHLLLIKILVIELYKRLKRLLEILEINKNIIRSKNF